MERFVLFALLVSCFCWQSVVADLVVIPRNTEAKINQSTYLNCSTNQSREIHWKHGDYYVYVGGTFYEGYMDRFNVDINNSTGAYNLIIAYVQPRDAGEYFCQDDGGHGQKRSAQLIVIADDPLCHSNMNRGGLVGPNSCEIKPDELQLSCSVTYHGNIPPQMEWRKAGESASIENVTSVRSGNNVTYVLSLKSDLSMNNQVYVCQTAKSATSQYQCNTETIKVQYVLSTIYTVNTTMGKEVDCLANSSQSCNYKWKWFKGEDTTTESNNRTLNPTKIGSHRCEASCSLGTKSCPIVVMYAEVYSEMYANEADAETNSVGLLGLLAVLVVLIIIIIIAFVCFMKRRRRKNSMKRPSASKERERSETPLIQTTSQTTKNTDPVISGKMDSDPREDKEQSQIPLIQTTSQPTKNTDPVISGEMDSDPRGLNLLEGKKPEFVSYIKRLNTETRITGITVLKTNIITATENSPALEFYDVQSFEFVERVPINQLMNPFDIACCHQSGFIFISDSKSKSVPKEIIRLEPDNTVGKRWSTGDDFGNLSVSCESNVILCVSDKNQLIEYTSDGGKIQVITLHGVIHPSHAIKRKSGDFVVCHGYKDDALHQVCITNKNGKVVKSFGGETGTSLQQLNEPKYLVADAKCILVVDTMNKRLLLLGSQLEYKEEFLTKKTGLLGPSKICLCKAIRSLAVVDAENQVMIFSIK